MQYYLFRTLLFVSVVLLFSLCQLFNTKNSTEQRFIKLPLLSRILLWHTGMLLPLPGWVWFMLLIGWIFIMSPRQRNVHQTFSAGKIQRVGLICSLTLNSCYWIRTNFSSSLSSSSLSSSSLSSSWIIPTSTRPSLDLRSPSAAKTLVVKIVWLIVLFVASV